MPWLKCGRTTAMSRVNYCIVLVDNIVTVNTSRIYISCIHCSNGPCIIVSTKIDRHEPPAPNPPNTTLLSELVTITVTRRLHCTLRRHAVIGTRRSSWFHHSTPARYWHAIFGLLVSASALWFSGPYRWVKLTTKKKYCNIIFGLRAIRAPYYTVYKLP